MNKAADDEPVFVLRANDPLAADVVEYWAFEAALANCHEPEKVAEAERLAVKMRAWRDKKNQVSNNSGAS